MLIPWVLSTAGLLILLLAGEALVKGAVNLSLRVGIPTLIVGLVVVGFGTSAPELVVTIDAVLDDKPGLALGNVVGSNTANILLVLGVPALLTGLQTSLGNFRKCYLYMLLTSVVFIFLAMRGSFDIWASVVLLGMTAYWLYSSAMDAKAHRACGGGNTDEFDLPEEDEDEIEGPDTDLPWWKIMVFLIGGLIALSFGADLLVENASIIARQFGVSEAVIGLTLVAFGTSLPELATTVVSAFRNHADVALGNVIGSNVFNLGAIIGVTSAISPIPVAPQFVQFDLWVMLGASLLLIPVVFRKLDMGRLAGLGLAGLYLAYVFWVL